RPAARMRRPAWTRAALEVGRHRELEDPAAALGEGAIGGHGATRGPIAAVGHVVDRSTQDHIMARDLGPVRSAQVQASPAVDLVLVRDAGVLRALVAYVGLQGQAGNTGHVPLAAQHRVKARYACGIIAVVDAVLGIAQLGLHQGNAAKQSPAIQWLAIHRKLDAPVALLAVGAEYAGTRVCIGLGFFDLKYAQT